MDSFIYSFRFCCDPDFNDQRELESLDRYITEACIDDVAVFCNVEELNTGHMTFLSRTGTSSCWRTWSGCSGPTARRCR